MVKNYRLSYSIKQTEKPVKNRFYEKLARQTLRKIIKRYVFELHTALYVIEVFDLKTIKPGIHKV